MTEPREILVRGPNWAGDLVMATPGFRALRAAFPAARIRLVVRAGLEPLVAGAPWFDEVIPFAAWRRGPLAVLREGLALRRRHGGFDLGICLPDSFASALHLRAAGARCLVGYASDGRGWLLHRAVDAPRVGGRRAWLPRERHVLGLVEAAGARPLGTQLELFVTDAEEARANALLAARGVTADAPLVVLAPGASYGPSKVWPPERFAAVGDALARTGAQVVLLGAPDERVLARRVAAAMARPVADLVGEADLGATKAVIRRARALVCNDAGARHVAVAFGVPCIVLMGPTSLAKTNLNLERVRVLSADVGCRPCYLRSCPIDHRCMTRIEPERVLEAALPALSVARTWRGDGALRPVQAPGGGEA
jgi:heptosyltransferase-2